MVSDLDPPGLGAAKKQGGAKPQEEQRTKVMGHQKVQEKSSGMGTAGGPPSFLEVRTYVLCLEAGNII